VWLFFWKGTWALKKRRSSYTIVFYSDITMASEQRPEAAKQIK